MMWSWDNAYAEEHPVAYLRVLTEAIDVLLAPGDGVDGIAVIQFPKVGPNDAIIDPAQRQQAQEAAEANRHGFDRIVSRLPARYPGRITYLPIASALEVDGRYSTWLPTIGGGWVRARKTDNTHLCPAGAAVLGAAVTSELSPMFHLPPPAPGWITGSWTKDGARFGPAGDCPDDQPPPTATDRADRAWPGAGRWSRPDGRLYHGARGPGGRRNQWTDRGSGPVEGRTRPCAACSGCRTTGGPSTSRRPTGSSVPPSSSPPCAACSATSCCRWCLPAIGVARGVGPAIGIPIGILALTFDYLGIRRFWLADHRQRWAFTALYAVVGGMVLSLVIIDLVSVLN